MLNKNITDQLDVIIKSAPLVAPIGADAVFASTFNVAVGLIDEGHTEEAIYLIKNFPVAEVMERSHKSDELEGLAIAVALKHLMTEMEED